MDSGARAEGSTSLDRKCLVASTRKHHEAFIGDLLPQAYSRNCADLYFSGVGPQAMRGIPNGFPNQQQMQNRNVSSRIPPGGKMANNGATWAFGGVPMGGAGLGNPRPNNGPMTSFAQTIGGSSQPATPLDLSEFPSLSGNQPQHNQSTWGAAGARNIGPSANMRLQQSAGLSAQHAAQQQQQQQQQDELFNSSTQLSNNSGGFRFGAQSAVGQSSQPSSADDFPPLRNSNGEIGQDRGSGLLQNVGFGGGGGLGFGSGNPPQQARSNGLLSALSGGSRVAPGNRVASPGSLSGPSTNRSPIDSSRQGLSNLGENEAGGFANTNFGSSSPIPPQEDNDQQFNMPTATSSRPDGPSTLTQAQELDPSSAQRNAENADSKVQDPLAHMSDTDRFGLKGFSYMMNNFPDYAALVTGTDINHLGLDLHSEQPISNQIYSLWDNEPPRPDVARFNLPECYRVLNVAPLESKMPSFNEEALLFMFYSNPGDKQQLMAARELGNRNWRYHKKLQVWLTKDDLMVPRQLSQQMEQGYYIFFDVKTWSRQRREFTLSYDDLERVEDRF